MALRKILYYPDPKLKTIAHPVTEINEEIKTLIDDMFDTMYEAKGCGLAATQIGVPLQLVVIDFGEEKKRNPLVLINPVITEQSGEQIFEEGCLSLPGLYEKVKRANNIKLTALDEKNAPFEICAKEDYFCQCLQHEIDHLHGKLFIDRLSPLKRSRAKKKLIKAIAN
ncbi:MAG: peptide deformylase [Gammaproteobacteria bacterium GWF2_41_13]|nr:MAG: peptide deformylase [Gammaproteobacteria bacterium GWF2_41_13]